jgi:hypothetical protein
LVPPPEGSSRSRRQPSPKLAPMHPPVSAETPPRKRRRGKSVFDE